MEKCTKINLLKLDLSEIFPSTLAYKYQGLI